MVEGGDRVLADVEAGAVWPSGRMDGDVGVGHSAVAGFVLAK